MRYIAVFALALGLAGSLAGCGSYGLLDSNTNAAFNSPNDQPAWLKRASLTSSPPDSDTTASTPTATGSANSNAKSDRADASAMSSLFARASGDKPAADAAPVRPVERTVAVKPVVVADAGDEIPVVAPPAANNIAAEPRGRAYLFRGIAGLLYSRGIDKLAERIKHVGIASSVDTYLMWRPVADQAIRDYRRDPQPIVLIGHSMGGDSALAFAETLNAEKIPVSLLVTLDPSRIADDVPPNVERYINVFQSSNLMGGGNVVQGARFHGHYASYNLKDHSEIIHINIEKTDRIQEQLVSKIVALAVTPAAAEGEGVPLHLEVPADAAIELWDSGLPVGAHAGDTLKTLAATYHVPLWSLEQINAVSDRAPLTEGQRVVVPRRLLPTVASATVSSYAPTDR